MSKIVNAVAQQQAPAAVLWSPKDGITLHWQVGTPEKPAAVTGMDLFVFEQGKVAHPMYL
ncbi:hypothetical protein [Chitinophaga agri]|uniref:Uncharacterized protein n=1 Tax=Chitinophaga agri TaxID=2703787 RepID=A0A6B9ZQM0_9BACT|nr:hypothetical protein [Chitinophaga agri]QHS63353.1 hypothetical protein GWR21_28325 [Chitinophaga agri]